MVPVAQMSPLYPYLLRKLPEIINDVKKQITSAYQIAFNIHK